MAVMFRCLDRNQLPLFSLVSDFFLVPALIIQLYFILFFTVNKIKLKLVHKYKKILILPN